MKRWSTVLDFIASGRAPTSETVVSFEGWQAKGDGGNSLWVKTGGTDAPSQTPTVRGNNTLTDSAGFVYEPVDGQVFRFNGDAWFPSPFGDSGEGLYQFTGASWDFYDRVENIITTYADTATMQAASPSALGQRAENRERGYAQYELKDLDYVPLPGDVTAANGRVWALQLNGGANVAWFGAVGDGVADDTQAIQDADSRGVELYLDPSVSFTTSIQFSLSSPVTVNPKKTWQALTANGNISWEGGRVSGDGANINRLHDRVFVGEASRGFAGNTLVAGGDVGDSSFSGDDTPSYIAYNSTLNVIAGPSQYAIGASAKGSDLAGAGVIGVGSAIVNDKPSGRGWCFIGEIQHEDGAFVTNGMEIAAKNKSTDNFTYRPYSASFGVFGTRYVAGGDNAFGGNAVNPSTAAVIVIKNETSGFGWNSGIVFSSDSLEGTDGSATSTGEAAAITMARKHNIEWYAPDGGRGAWITSNVTDSTNNIKQQFINNGANFIGSNGRQLVRFEHTSNAVNYLKMANSATGLGPALSSEGDDANIDLRLTPKGSGLLRFGAHQSIASEVVTGFIEIKDSSGNIRKVAVVS